MTVRATGSTFIAATFILAVPALLLAQRPNPVNTPGAKTKASDAQVCAADFEATATKPIPGYERTDALKRYGRHTDDFQGELDHLIPVSLGGSNSADNLWPIPDNKQYGVAQKRELEATLHSMVCDKKITLKAAQDAIKKDWTKAYDQYVKKTVEVGGQS